MLIDYKKVDIYHKDGAPVLHDIDFHVDEGEFIYIIGRVGTGKSSLLKTIYFEMEVEKAETAEKKKKLIEEAGMELDDEELEQVSGGLGNLKNPIVYIGKAL